jgi:2,2-dialkylglycine decarboxylase (pyruvate)
MTPRTNMDLWDTHGSHVIPVMPFLDSILARCDGSWLVDVEGRRILDLAAGQFCAILGHGHPRFVEALTAELSQNLHSGSQFVTERTLETLSELAAIMPEDLRQLVLLSTGSEANEFALRVAKLYTGRSGAAGFDRGYYGISLATRGLSTISEDRIDFSPRPQGVSDIIAPSCARCPLKLSYPSCELACLDLSLRLMGEQAENIAAVFVEPIVSAGGMIYPTPEYMQALSSWTRDIGALLVVDEAQTGFGRCGTWFDCENLGITPDILVFSKSSGNGYPSAGVAISERISERLLDRGFSHLSSHQNDSLAAAAVSAVIRIVREEGYRELARASGEYFLQRLRELESQYRHIGGVRGRGLMIAFELVRDRETMIPWAEMLTPFVLACEARGVHVTYTYYEGAIRIIPPLNISREDIDFAVEAFGQVLGDLEHGRLDGGAYAQRNPVIRKILRRNPLRRKLMRMWETTPKYWLSKLHGPR